MDQTEDTQQTLQDTTDTPDTPEEPESVDTHTPTPQATDGDMTVVMSLESMIKTNITQTAKLREEYTKYREMIEDILANDPVYVEHEKITKDAIKQKSATKKQVLKRPEAAQIDGKVKELSAQIKENSQALSEYLQEFARISGVNEIEGEDGQLRQIVYVAKLSKKSIT